MIHKSKRVSNLANNTRQEAANLSCQVPSIKPFQKPDSSRKTTAKVKMRDTNAHALLGRVSQNTKQWRTDVLQNDTHLQCNTMILQMGSLVLFTKDK